MAVVRASVSITVAELTAELRLNDTAEETAEVTRLLAYATEAVTQHAPDASETAMNEAVRRLAGYLFDQPEAGRGMAYANALRSSGAARMLLPYRIHRLGLSDAVEAAQAVGTASNPVTGLAIESGQLVITFEDGSTDALDLVAGDQTARDSAASAQSEIDAHEASTHNTDTVARSTARNARQVGEQAQNTIEAHEGTPHGGGGGVDQTARAGLETHEASTHNTDTVARSTARNARQVGEQAQNTIEAHEGTPHGGGGARVELYRDTATYRRTSASPTFRQFDLSRAPARGKGLELVIASTNRNWMAPFYCGTTDDWLDMGALSPTQLNNVISAGTVPVSNTILLKSVAFNESNSNAFGHGIVYVGRVHDSRIGVAFSARRGVGERFRMTVREIP